ncbi:MAG: GIY-YIG nuclease family protein [Candidatus Moranbacteria bacterium]|nr:GIY-YIG nuclease family protein [Candidatus Moranbacteria bacterium]
MKYVYSLKCRGGYYVGCTCNLKDRLDRHQRGYVPATKDRLPFELDSYVAVKDKYKALQLEKYSKAGSGRAFIRKHFT